LGRNKLPGGSSHIDQFVRDLPDPQGARLFYQNLTAAHPRFAKTLNGDPGLLSDLLALCRMESAASHNPPATSGIHYSGWRAFARMLIFGLGSSAGITGAVRADKFFD